MKRIAAALALTCVLAGAAGASDYDLEIRDEFGSRVDGSSSGGDTPDYASGTMYNSFGNWTVSVSEYSDPYGVGYDVSIYVNGGLYQQEYRVGSWDYTVPMFYNDYISVDLYPRPDSASPDGGDRGDGGGLCGGGTGSAAGALAWLLPFAAAALALRRRAVPVKA